MIYWQFVFLSLSMLHFFPYLCRNYCQLEQTWKRWTTRKFPFNNSSIFLSQPSLHFILQSAVSFGTSTQALDNNEISVMHTSIDFFVPLFATHNDALCTQWRLCSVFHIQTHTHAHISIIPVWSCAVCDISLGSASLPVNLIDFLQRGQIVLREIFTFVQSTDIFLLLVSILKSRVY